MTDRYFPDHLPEGSSDPNNRGWQSGSCWTQQRYMHSQSYSLACTNLSLSISRLPAPSRTGNGNDVATSHVFPKGAKSAVWLPALSRTGNGNEGAASHVFRKGAKSAVQLPAPSRTGNGNDVATSHVFPEGAKSAVRLPALSRTRNGNEGPTYATWLEKE